MKPLYISPGGEFLFHSTSDESVDVWDLRDGAYVRALPGGLLGVERSGRRLLTGSSGGAVKAWEACTGAECALKALDAAELSLHQRFVAAPDRYKLLIELRDALGIEPKRVVRIEHDPRYYPALEACALAPDDRSLVVTLAGEVAGQGWASGLCVDLASGARRFKFKVNKFRSLPPFNFSREHNLLMISDDIYHLSVFDLSTGHIAGETWVSGFTNVAAAMVSDPRLVAVSVWGPVASTAVSPFEVQILNLGRISAGGMRRAAVEAVLPEPQAVHGLFCAPDGIHLASLLESGVIHWWNLAAGQVEATFAAPWIV